MTTATEHTRTLLAAIIPDRSDLLERALRDLSPEQIPDRILANLLTMLERYAEITGAVVTRDALASLLAATKADAGTIAAYQETYDELAQLNADEAAFRWALHQIRELAAERGTRDVLTQGMEILNRGAEDERGMLLRGHADARAHVLTCFADIDRSIAKQDAPEGDIRTEAQDILAEYAAQEKARLEGRSRGVLFGVPALDDRVDGLHPGELVLIVGYTSDGKAQPLDAPVLTPSGWQRMGDLHVGDAVVDPKGAPSLITGIYPQGIKAIYRLTFSDGSTAEATEDHLWSVRAWRSVRGQQSRQRLTLTMTTAQLLEELQSNRRNPVLDTTEGLAGVDFATNAATPIDPYCLGLLLGDGHFGKTISFTNHDDDEQLAEALSAGLEPLGVRMHKMRTRDRVVSYQFPGCARQEACVRCERPRRISARGLCHSCYEMIRQRGGLEAYAPTGRAAPILRQALEELGLGGTRSWNKFVPGTYKFASAAVRLAILQGLMDTDGRHERGRATFSSASQQLRDDVIWLARSLGLRATSMIDKVPTYIYNGERRQGRATYRCSIWERPELRVFRLERKIKRLVSRDAGRAIVAIDYLRDAQAQCISVSAPSKLYVTNDFVPTHNTSLSVQLAWSAAIEQGKNVLFLTTETVRGQVRRKLVARHSCLPAFGGGDGLNSRDIKFGSLTVEEKSRLVACVEDLDTNPDYGKLYVAQVPRGSAMSYVESKSLRVSRDMHIDLLVMDYLALLRPDRKRPTTREELSETLKAAKQLATSLNDGAGVPFVSPWQVSRSARVEAEAKKAYTLAALSETAETSNSADTIVSLLAPIDNQDRRTKVKAQVMKHRDGERANSVELLVDYATSKFSGEYQQRFTTDSLFDPLSVLA